MPNSVAIWQAFRDEYSPAVIFGKASVDDALKQAADEGRPNSPPSPDRATPMTITADRPCGPPARRPSRPGDRTRG